MYFGFIIKSLDLVVFNLNLLASIQSQVLFISEFSLDFSRSIDGAVTTKDSLKSHIILHPK